MIKNDTIIALATPSGIGAIAVIRLSGENAITIIDTFFKSIKKGAPKLLIVSVSLVFAGALGNIIDSVFYGVIFNAPLNEPATMFAAEPYGELLYGKVVDMLYFPIWKGTLPKWIPGVGGDRFTFFNAIFNVADTAISIAVGIMIFFNKKVFPKGL